MLRGAGSTNYTVSINYDPPMVDGMISTSCLHDISRVLLLLLLPGR